jgi:hypothetical protein
MLVCVCVCVCVCVLGGGGVCVRYVLYVMYEVIYRWDEGSEITQFQVNITKVCRTLTRFMSVNFIIGHEGESRFCVSVSCVFSIKFFQFFIIYVSSQQLQGQLQTQHSVDTSNYIMGEHNLKSKSNER